MRSISLLPLLAVAPALVHAATHFINVGGLKDDGTPNLVFDPDNIIAEVGDNLLFMFNVKNHTATQSSFQEPCAHLTNATTGQQIGFDSGFNPVTLGTSDMPTFNVTVNDTKPIWVYCRQTASPKTHCQSGMVFAANANANTTFTQFQNNALASTIQNTNSTTANTTSSAPPTSTSSAANTGVTHFIEVGGTNADGSPKLMFDPANVIAQPGDYVQFKFNVKNHTATQSSFPEPCAPLTNATTGQHIGFDSGFNPVSANATSTPTFEIRVNDSSPIWGYCRQTATPKTHCQQGMVFAINAQQDPLPNTFPAYQKNALASTSQNTNSSSSSSSAWPSSTSGGSKDLAALDSSSSSSDSSDEASNVHTLLSYAPIMLGLLGACVVLLLAVLGMGACLLMKMRKTGDQTRNISASYRPLSLPKSKAMDDGSHDYDEPRYADTA